MNKKELACNIYLQLITKINDVKEADLNCDNIMLKDLRLSVRTRNTLLSACINTIGDLSRISMVILLRTRNFGSKSVEELVTELNRHHRAVGDGLSTTTAKSVAKHSYELAESFFEVIETI